jgi:hypothetical protein
MKNSLVTILIISVLLILGGCATPYKLADYQAETLDSRIVNEIAILPVLDLRADKSKSLNLDEWVHKMSKQRMKKRGYEIVVYGDRGLIRSLQNIPQRDILDQTINNYELDGASRWIMIMCLEDSYSKLTFGSTGNAEMSAYFIDQEKHELLWKHKAVGQIGQGGLIGMAMKGVMERSAIEVATTKIVNSFPPKGK